MDITAIQEVRWTNSDKHKHGVGFVIKDNVATNIVRFQPISDQICYIELKCKWYNMFLINCYAPTEDKSDDIKNKFYEDLDLVCDTLPIDKPKIILGDFNAKIGKENNYKPTIGSESLHEITNDNGNKLITFATANNMIISNTYFPHKNIHKQAWISPLDNRIKSCVKDIKNMRGSSAMSDHFLAKNKYKEKINKDILKTTTAKVYQEKIVIELRDIQKMVNLNEAWEKVEQAIKITAKKKRWFNEECKAAQEEKDRARTKVLQNPSEDNKRLLAQKQRDAKKVIRRNKRLWEKERIHTIENNRNNNSRIFFEKANEVKRGYQTRPTAMKKHDGSLLTESKEIACEFKDMFEKLLNQPNENNTILQYSTVEQQLEKPSEDEVKMGLDMLKNGKAPGDDEIVSECLKKRDQGKSTTDQIHIVKQVVEKSHEYNKDTYLLFVDFKAAYDSINRDKLWEVMDSLGIPAKLTRLIKSCTYNSKSKISFGGELSEEFQVTTGLRQGDALSPALFNIALESVMRAVISQAKGIEIKDNQHLTAVAYADDIVLLAETVDDLKNTTDILLKEGEKLA
ncbi:hypothetical protein QTP88_028922 [Uroleucon formosanum]